MALYLLYGSGYNLIARAAVAPTPTPTAQTKYPVANLYDGTPNKPMIFTWTLNSIPNVVVDLNQVINGDSEAAYSGGLPGTAFVDGLNAGWSTVGGGTYTRNTASPKNGAATMEISGGIGTFGAYIIEASAGEELSFHVWLRNAGAGTATVQIINMDSLYYLNSSGAWQASSADWASNATSTYTEKATTVSVQSYATLKKDRTRILMTFSKDGYYDDVFCWPSVSFVSLHGHNLPASAFPLTLDSGTADPPTTNRASISISQPTCFATCALTAQRYWRVKATASPFQVSSAVTDAVYYGELVLGQYQTATRRQNYGQDYALLDPQQRTQNDIGPLQAFLQTTAGRRQVSMQFRLNDTATDYAFSKEVLERSRNGAHPLVVVVESGDATTAIMGRVESRWSHTRVTNAVRDFSLTLDELAFPIVVA